MTAPIHTFHPRPRLRAVHIRLAILFLVFAPVVSVLAVMLASVWEGR